MTKPIKGVLLIDKPKGKTSPQITKEIAKNLETKAGHCGALDPFATGILPIAIGKTVKIQEYIQRMDKEYTATIETSKYIEKNTLKEKLETLQGKTIQLPPEKSSVKREEREREIYSIEKIRSTGKQHIFNVSCQHGTYIRVLVKDLEEKLGIKTTLKELRRINLGPWNIKNTHNPEKITKNNIGNKLITIEEALKEYPEAEIKESALKSITHGEDLKAPGIKRLKGNITPGKEVKITHKEKVVAIGQSLFTKEEIEKKRRGVIIKTKKVIVNPVKQ